jgi:spore germination protein GerM
VKGMRMKGIITLLLAGFLLCAAAVAGCAAGELPGETPEENALPGVDNGNSKDGVDNPEPGPVEGTKTVTIYLADRSAVAGGTPGEFGYVTPVAVTVSGGSSRELLIQAMEALLVGPEDRTDEVGPVAPASAAVLSASIENGTATVDFSRELIADSPGGTMGGQVFVQAAVLTATGLPGVDSLQVLVEGKPWNDGHMVWERPLSRDEVLF